jgi:hypothetical protein
LRRSEDDECRLCKAAAPFGDELIDECAAGAVVLEHRVAQLACDEEVAVGADLTQVEYAVDDARYIALLKRWWDARAWEPDDPRVDELAAAAADHLLANPKLLTVMTGFLPKADAAIRHELLDDYRADVAPSWVRLSALLEATLLAAGIDITGR